MLPSTEKTSTAAEDKTEKVPETPTPAASVNSNLNLSSSSNFVNGNQDDLSLPELPTSECTPLSTTLNTPTHSDNEEESTETRDTRDSLIDFSHSPIKFRKASTGDELQFDFHNDAPEISKDGADKTTLEKEPEDKSKDKGRIHFPL